MTIKEDIKSIVENIEDLDSESLLRVLLPKKSGSYSIEEVQDRLYLFRDEIEDLQRDSNNVFDATISEETFNQLKNLYQKIHNTHLDVLRLQCQIAFTKEQYEEVNMIRVNPIVRERQEIASREEHIRRSLQQMKFGPVKEFFDKFATYLRNSVADCRKVSSHYAANYLQLFDWTQYHQAIFLLRACGKALIDISKFERIYQSDLVIDSITFKQPIEHMDFNNFIEFQDTYSIESQLEFNVGSNQKRELKDLLLEPSLMAIVNSNRPIDYVVFESLHSRFKSTTVECCGLIIELNMNYIEAYLTDGINIDKLNGGENASLTSMDDQNMPLYALSPQEYITQIGQHLLTLRKQTEQFDNMNNESLRYGLLSLSEAQNIPINVESYKTVTEIIMRCTARHCVRSLLARTNNSIISKLTQNGKRQLATDALYLDNVLEDLGLLDPTEPNVEKFKNLLIN